MSAERSLTAALLRQYAADALSSVEMMNRAADLLDRPASAQGGPGGFFVRLDNGQVYLITPGQDAVPGVTVPLPCKWEDLNSWALRLVEPDTGNQRQALCREWLEKTEWVQNDDSFPFPTLSMHRADIMRQEIERLRAQVHSIRNATLREAEQAAEKACTGYSYGFEIVNAVRALTVSAQPAHCVEGEHCVCGGDLPRVRAGCPNWRTK